MRVTRARWSRLAPCAARLQEEMRLEALSEISDEPGASILVGEQAATRSARGSRLIGWSTFARNERPPLGVIPHARVDRGWPLKVREHTIDGFDQPIGKRIDPRVRRPDSHITSLPAGPMWLSLGDEEHSSVEGLGRSLRTTSSTADVAAHAPEAKTHHALSGSV